MGGPVEQLRGLLAAAPIEMAKSIEATINDFVRRGMLRSGMAIVAISKSWMNATETALFSSLERIAAQKPPQKDWVEIQTEALSFLDSQAAAMWNRLRGMYQNEADLAQGQTDTLKAAITARVEAYVAGQKLPLRERKADLFWDMVKVIVGGILGSVITWLLSRPAS